MTNAEFSVAIDPVAMLQDRLGIDEIQARDLANIAVVCPIPGIDRQQSLGEFMASEHGAEKAVTIVNIAKDARLMAETLYLGQIDMEEPKTSLIRPTLVGHDRELVTRETSTRRSGTMTFDEEERATKGEDIGYTTDERLTPIYEDRPTSVFSLDEQIHKLSGLIVNQGVGECIVKAPTPTRFKVPHVETPRIREERVLKFKEHAKQTLRAGDSSEH